MRPGGHPSESQYHTTTWPKQGTQGVPNTKTSLCLQLTSAAPSAGGGLRLAQATWSGVWPHYSKHTSHGQSVQSVSWTNWVSRMPVGSVQLDRIRLTRLPGWQWAHLVLWVDAIVGFRENAQQEVQGWDIHAGQTSLMNERHISLQNHTMDMKHSPPVKIVQLGLYCRIVIIISHVLHMLIALTTASTWLSA